MPQITDGEIYAQLRQAIDQGDVGRINDIFNDHPGLNWDAVTLNRLSALWWALVPPSNQPVNLAVVNCLLGLERNNQAMIDLSQTYAGLRPEPYIYHFIKMDDYSKAVSASITEAGSRTIRPINIEMPTPPLAQDMHSASNPLILHASDANLKRLYQRYGNQLEVENEFKNIETFLETSAFKTAFPLIREQQDQIHHALKRIKDDHESRSGATAEGPYLLKEALALVWSAAREENPRVLPNQASIDPIDRQKAILTSLLEAQSTYGLDKYSCWAGTWGRIGTALCGLHQDVVYQEDNELPFQLASYQYSALIGHQLDQTYQNDRPTYWAILRYMLLDDRKEDQRIYAAWLEKTRLSIENELRQSRAKEEDIASLIQQAEERYLPLSNHLLTFQFSFLLNKFSIVKKPDLFKQHIELLQNEDINDVFQGLKAAYCKCMTVPKNLTALEIQKKEALKQSILEGLLTNRDAEEITEEKLWPAARTELRIKTNLPNRYSWYQNLTLDKQLLLTQEQPDLDAVTDKTILLFALKHACITGLSLAGADLSSMDFRGWDLRGIDFRGANLTGADLQLITAKEAKWEKCNLKGSYFNQWLYPEALIGSVHCNSELLAVRNIEGNTVLHKAVEDNNLAGVQVILDSPHCTGEVFATPNYCGRTALHKAVGERHLEIMQVILDSRHCISNVLAVKDNHGRTALHIPMWNFSSNQELANLKIVQAILNSPYCTSDVLAVKDNDGETSLHLAVQKNILNFVSAIVKSHHCTSDILAIKHNNGSTARHNDGETALYKAVKNNNLAIVQVILDSPYCNSNVLAAQDYLGNTILHLAVKNNEPRIVQAILQSPFYSKTLLKIKNLSGENLFDIAKNPGKYAKEVKELAKYTVKGKEDLFIHITLPDLLKNQTRSEILDLFKHLKDRENGKYKFIHEQKNKKWDNRRLSLSSKFFKSHHNEGESDFWHTHTYQQAVKLLKQAYFNANGPVGADKKNAEKAFMDYIGGNFPRPLQKTTPRKLFSAKCG